MEITDVRVRMVSKVGRMRAVASITLDNEFVVHDIKILAGDKGLFIAMPSRKTVDGEFRDIAHPISHAAREKIQASVLSKYETTASLDETEDYSASDYSTSDYPETLQAL